MRSTVWQGADTVSRPHTDSENNVICVFSGHKNFTVVSPQQREFVYPGGVENMPPNYSPVDFLKPDLEKWPMFAHARVWDIHV